MNNKLLEIKNLKASINEKLIIIKLYYVFIMKMDYYNNYNLMYLYEKTTIIYNIIIYFFNVILI